MIASKCVVCGSTGLPMHIGEVSNDNCRSWHRVEVRVCARHAEAAKEDAAKNRGENYSGKKLRGKKDRPHAWGSSMELLEWHRMKKKAVSR